MRFYLILNLILNFKIIHYIFNKKHKLQIFIQSYKIMQLFHIIILKPNRLRKSLLIFNRISTGVEF